MPFVATLFAVNILSEIEEIRNSKAMKSYSVLTSLRHAMGSWVKKQLLFVLALSSAPIVDTLLKGNQIAVGRVVIPILLGWGTLIVLRLFTSKRLASVLSLSIAEREIIYERKYESPIKKGFNDIRRISERMGEGLRVQFFDAKADILISANTTEYAEIKRKLSTEFFLEEEGPANICVFASVAGVAAIVFELLVLRGNVIHGVVAVALGLVVGFELLSIPTLGAFWRQSALRNRIEILAGTAIFLYSMIRIMAGG